MRPRHLNAIFHALLTTDAMSATKYVDPRTVVTATLRRDSQADHAEFVVTVGKPNYRQRKFIAACKKAGVAFPVRKVQLRYSPKPRALKRKA